MRAFLIAVALAAGLPAGAQAQPSAASEAEEAADQQAYYVWLQRVQAIYSPVFSQLQAYQAAHVAGWDLPAPRRLALLRPRAAELLGLIGRAEAELVALQSPPPFRFEMAPELRPQAIVRDLSGGMGALRTIVSGSVEVLEHGAAGRSAAQAQAEDRVVQAVGELTRTQIRLGEARMNAYLEEDPSRYIVGLDLATQKLSQTLLGSFDDPASKVRRELLALAEETERWVDTGLSAADQEKLRLESLSPSATVAAEAAVLAKNLRALSHQRAQLEIGRELVAVIRKAAGEAEAPAFQDRLPGYMKTARAIGDRIYQQEEQVASILAAP